MNYLNLENNIFVSIASFRDSECNNTLKDLYMKADNPENIFCGIFTQIDNNIKTEQCYDSNFPYNTQIRRMLINYKDAKGPLWARIKIIKQLYQNEKYFLMIDAHTLFKKGWDTNLISFLNTLKNKGIQKPILSGYPANFSDKDKDDKNSFLLCNIVNGNNYPEVLGAERKEEGYYYQSYFISAGCLFTYSKFLQEINIIKIAENLQYIYSGEEMLLSLLAYVNGWDIYSIPYTNIYHQYKTNEQKKKDKTQWTLFANIDNDINNKSHKNLKELLTSNTLDSIRTVSDFYKKIGYNKENGLNFTSRFPQTSKDNLCNNTKKIKFN